MDFQVQVLTTGNWPSYTKLNDLKLPLVMLRCTQVYQDYYEAKNNSMRLTWTHSLGQCNIKGTFGKKSFELQVTTLQAIVLLAFNKDKACPGGVTGEAVSFVALQEALSMTEDVLKRVLHSLAWGKYKVLKRIISATPTTTATAEGEVKADKIEKAQKGVLASDIYAFNEQFT